MVVPQGLGNVWRVPSSLCAGRRVAIVASGPSAPLASPPPDAFVVAIGRSVELLDRVDLLFAADPRTWLAYPHLLDWQGVKVALTREDKPTGATVLNRLQTAGVLLLGHAGNEGLSDHPASLAGFNAVHQAINLAVLGGAASIELHGADFCRGPAGETHWHGDHPYPQKLDFHAQLAQLERLRAHLTRLGVRVVNATPGSALAWS